VIGDNGASRVPSVREASAARVSATASWYCFAPCDVLGEIGRKAAAAAAAGRAAGRSGEPGHELAYANGVPTQGVRPRTRVSGDTSLIANGLAGVAVEPYPASEVDQITPRAERQQRLVVDVFIEHASEEVLELARCAVIARKTRRIDPIDRIRERVAVKVAGPAVKSDRIFRRPASQRRVVVARPEADQFRVLIVEAPGKAEGLKAGLRIVQPVANFVLRDLLGDRSG